MRQVLFILIFVSLSALSEIDGSSDCLSETAISQEYGSSSRPATLDSILATSSTYVLNNAESPFLIKKGQRKSNWISLGPPGAIRCQMTRSYRDKDSSYGGPMRMFLDKSSKGKVGNQLNLDFEFGFGVPTSMGGEGRKEYEVNCEVETQIDEGKAGSVALVTTYLSNYFKICVPAIKAEAPGRSFERKRRSTQTP